MSIKHTHTKGFYNMERSKVEGYNEDLTAAPVRSELQFQISCAFD